MSKRARERGSILLHVMVTGAVMALIAATLLRMTMLRYQVSSRSQKILAENNDNQAVLSSILKAWNSANGGGGQTCANVVIAGYAYAGTPGTCNCTYTPSPQTVPPTLPTFATTGNVVMGSAPNTFTTCGVTMVSADR